MEIIDQKVLTFFTDNRTEWLNFAMLYITYLGGYLAISGITAISAIRFFVSKKINLVMPLLFSVVGSSITVFLIKSVSGKNRPAEEALYLETSSAMPSGHATAAMALYGFLFALILKKEKRSKWSLISLAGLIILVGLSRLYLGVHYLSDVLVGYLIGFVWIWISLAIAKPKP